MLELLAYGDSGWGDELLRGLSVTLMLAILSFAVGVTIGMGLMLVRRTGRLARVIVAGYAAVFRGVPELLVIYLFFFGTGVVVREVAGSFGYTERINLSGFLLGALALIVIAAANAAEVFRGAAKSIPFGQYEAHQAFGFSPLRGFLHIELPQLLRVALPALGNIWLTLLKDTALVSLTSVAELMRHAAVAAGATHKPFTFYAVAAVIYFAVSLGSQRALTGIERRYAFDGRA